MDIGGTHISAAVIDKKEMRLHGDAAADGKVDSQASKDVILKQWEPVIDEVVGKSEGPIQKMLVSIPGPFDYEKGICLMDDMHKYQSLLYMDIRSYLADRYGLSPDSIHFFNDAQAFLLGEVYHHGMEGRKVVGLTLGTGLGSAYYDGETVRDLNYGSAPFRNGIAEDYISTRGILSFLERIAPHDFRNIKQLVVSDDHATEKEMAFDFLSTTLHDFIQQYVLPLQPDDIVLGGSIAKAKDLFLEDTQKNLSIPIRTASFNELNLFFGLTSTITI